MGLGLVFPILNALIMDPNGGFFTQSLTNEMRNLIYGLTIATFMLCWFFGAAFLGDLSDQIGRKKSLLICLLGSFFGYALSAIAIVTIFSNQVDENSQGWVMGITGAIMAFVFGINGLIVAVLADFSAKLPILIAAIGLGLACLCTYTLYQENNSPSKLP